MTTSTYYVRLACLTGTVIATTDWQNHILQIFVLIPLCGPVHWNEVRCRACLGYLVNWVLPFCDGTAMTHVTEEKWVLCKLEGQEDRTNNASGSLTGLHDYEDKCVQTISHPSDEFGTYPPLPSVCHQISNPVTTRYEKISIFCLIDRIRRSLTRVRVISCNRLSPTGVI